MPRFGGGWCSPLLGVRRGARGSRKQLLAIGVPMDDTSFAAAVTELRDANLPVTNATLFVALKGIFDSVNSKHARDFFDRSNDEFREARIRLDQLLRYGRDQETEGLPATLNSFLSSPAGLPWGMGTWRCGRAVHLLPRRPVRLWPRSRGRSLSASNLLEACAMNKLGSRCPARSKLAASRTGRRGSSI